MELEVSFQSPNARECGLDVLTDSQGENDVRVAILPEIKILRVGKVNAPFELKPGENLTLRVFPDKNLVEVFANDRQAAVAAENHVPDNLGLRLFSKGGDSFVRPFKSWQMKSIY